jgi:hypothetical protein
MSTRTDDEADILRLDNTWDEAHAHRAGTHSPTAHRGMVRSRSACEVRGFEVILLSAKDPCGFQIQPLKPKTGYLCSVRPQLDATNRKTRMALIRKDAHSSPQQSRIRSLPGYHRSCF